MGRSEIVSPARTLRGTKVVMVWVVSGNQGLISDANFYENEERLHA
jgi:hypothetical protein